LSLKHGGTRLQVKVYNLRQGLLEVQRRRERWCETLKSCSVSEGGALMLLLLLMRGGCCCCGRHPFRALRRFEGFY
jgi:hypothetical protein